MLIRPGRIGSIGRTRALSTGGAVPEIYLPASPAPQYAVGMARLVEGYTGPAIEIRRASDSAVLNLAALPDTVDMSGYAAFVGASVTTASKAYDQAYLLNGQAVNARDFVTPSTSNQPLIRPRNAIRGHQTASLGINSDGGSNYNKSFVNASLVNSMRATTTMWVGAIGGGATNSLGLFGLGPIGSTTTSLNLLYDTSSQISKLYPNTSTSFGGIGGPPAAQLAVITVKTSATHHIMRINGQVVYSNAVAPPDISLTGVHIGRGAWTTAAIGSFDWVAQVGYDQALSDAQMLEIETALAAKFDITMQPFTRCITFEGDSITDGRNESGYLINLLRLTQEDFHDPSLITVDFGGGDGAISSMNTSKVGTFNAGYKAGYTRQMHHIWAGTNDLIARASGAIAGHGTTMWTSSLLPYIQYMTDPSRYGSRVVVATMLPRGWLGSSTDKAEREAERLIYNQLIRDNAATYGYTVADYGGIAAFVSGPSGGNPNYPNLTYYGASSDVHIKENGYRLCADILTPIAQAMLA